MKPNCMNFIVCVTCEVFRNKFQNYIFYIQCVYVCIPIFACDVFEQFLKPFLRGTASISGVPFPHQGFLPLFLFSILLYSLLQVTLMIANFWHLAPSEAVCSRNQRPFDRAQLLFSQWLQTGQTVGICFGKRIWFLT